MGVEHILYNIYIYNYFILHIHIYIIIYISDIWSRGAGVEDDQRRAIPKESTRWGSRVLDSGLRPCLS